MANLGNIASSEADPSQLFPLLAELTGGADCTREQYFPKWVLSENVKCQRASNLQPDVASVQL